MKSFKYLVQGNEKLGSGIFAFNITPGLTCPGATDACSKVCYARRYMRQYENAKTASDQRYTASQLPEFVDGMTAEIHQRGATVVRVHSSGDFYSNAYINDWIKIVKACPQTAFYTYTRSWRVKSMLSALQRLRRLPNMQLWWSIDAFAQNAPEGLCAYLSLDDKDKPPEGVSLVFRNNRQTLVKRLGGVLVCPHENGTEKASQISCSLCKLCYKNTLVENTSTSEK